MINTLGTDAKKKADLTKFLLLKPALNTSESGIASIVMTTALKKQKTKEFFNADTMDSD